MPLAKANSAPQPTKRERLVDAARSQLHLCGYSGTSLAKIANAAEVPIGNVYYYFKTKDELVQAVVEEEVEAIHSLLDEAQSAGLPQQRLLFFLEQLRGKADEVAEQGCPLGGLSRDLDRLKESCCAQPGRLFEAQLVWFEQQFSAAGRDDSEQLALHLLARLQGASAICNAFGNPDLLQGELDRACEWVESVT